MRNFENDFYGDNLRFFIGIVEDVDDPMKLGRVRVRVIGLHSSSTEDIAVSDLPWSQVLIPSTEGGVSGYGRFSHILPGASVFGIFLDGKTSQIPLVLGSLPRIEEPSRRQTSSSVGTTSVPSGPSSTVPGTGVTGQNSKVSPENVSGYGMIGSTSAEIAYNYFVNYGFTSRQAAGIVGNLVQESGARLSTTIKSAGSEQSYGIAQWNSSTVAGNRLGLLKEFAKDVGESWDTLPVQLRFITYELENYSYLGLATLRRSSTISQSTRAFQDKYERPGVPHFSSRLAHATDIYNRYSRASVR